MSADDGPQPPWDDIFSILDAWRTGGTEPSVTALALETGRDPWTVLVSTILSLRTKDEVTLAASHRLLARAPSPADLLRLGIGEIESLAYPAGFYRTKAKNLAAIAAILMERYSGKVPAEMDALLALPGVGRKTANLVLSEAFGIDAVCVDIHVHRICNRAGWVSAATPDETETALRSILPRPYWRRINALLVAYGQSICRPVSPRCSVCPLYAHCRRISVGRSR